MKNELNPEVLFSNLAQFTGTTQYHQITTRTVLTDGTRYLADAAGCYWLMDAIASHLAGLPEAAGFAHCTLKLDGQSAELTIGDGNGERRQKDWLGHLELLDREGMIGG
jgi:hypothetical protein